MIIEILVINLSMKLQPICGINVGPVRARSGAVGQTERRTQINVYYYNNIRINK
jgi:hypothetical protein